MKKIDMILIIAARLAENEGSIKDNILFATDILDVIENAGMLPPIEPHRTVYDLDLGVPEWEE